MRAIARYVATTLIDIPARFDQPRRIGRGGMGEIWLVRDTELARDVVLKVLRPEFAADHEVARRFRREALAAARLSGHPHVVTVFDVGEHDDRPYIVMEYLPGGTVADRIRAGDVSDEAAVRWISEAAEALDAAHAAGVVHRDVKPGNLLLDDRDRIRVGDFGIARAIDAASATQTEPGMVLGTAGYLSPEQAAGHDVGPASDRYSLAVVAFELLAGRRPFERESVTAEAAAHVHDVVPSLRASVDPVFARALAKDPDARYDSAVELAQELRTALGSGADGTSWYTAGLRRRALGMLAGVGVLLVLLVVALARDEAPPRVATTTAAEATDELSRDQAIALNERAFALIQQERFAEALPLARRALANLRGVTPYEAYADYNVGVALLGLGHCAEAIPYLDRSEQLQGHRDEIDAARKQANECLAPAKDAKKPKGHDKHKH